MFIDEYRGEKFVHLDDLIAWIDDYKKEIKTGAMNPGEFECISDLLDELRAELDT